MRFGRRRCCAAILGKVARAALVEGAGDRCRGTRSRYSGQSSRCSRRRRDSVDGGAGVVRRGGVRAEARRRAHSGAQVRRRGPRVFTRASRRDCRGAGSRRSGSRACTARELILDGEVLALQPDGTPLAVPGDDAPIRPAARHRSPSHGAAADAVLFRLPLHRRPAADRRTATRTVRGCCSDVAGRPFAVPHQVIRDAATAAEFFDDAIAAGHEGVMAKVARRALRRRQPRQRMAEDQARSHARSRRACRRVGQRPAQGLAEQSPSRRA